MSFRLFRNFKLVNSEIGFILFKYCHVISVNQETKNENLRGATTLPSDSRAFSI